MFQTYLTCSTIYILIGLKLFQSLEMVLCLAYYIAVVMRWEFNRGVATSMIARHKKPRHDLIDVLHLKSCGAAEKSLRGCLRRAIIEVATSR